MRRALFGSLAVALLPEAVPAQEPAASYAPRFAELMAMAPRADRVATVNGLVLERDRARFTLASGTLHLLTPVGGRTVAAVFKGKGSLALTPPTAIERARLRRFSGSDSLQEAFTEMVLIFADSTAAELERRLSFAAGDAPGSLRSLIKRALDYQGEEKEEYFAPDLMELMLNGGGSDLFYAHVARDGGDPWMFTLNPSLVEGIQLSRRARGSGFTRFAEVAAQFPRQGAPAVRPGGGERLRQAEISHYAIETFLPRTGAGNVNFSAVARMDITSQTPIGPWVAFDLYYKLEVDSARWKDGGPANVFKGRESPTLWISLDRGLAAGETRTLELFYHGDLVDRYSEWFFIKSSASWYPRPLEGRSAATFELTYHTPKSYLFASAGELVDSAEASGTVTTRWVATEPMRNASFNLGRFEQFPYEGPAGLPITLLYSEAGHRALFGAGGSRVTKQVGEDISGSLRFFDHVFGAPPMKRFYATEIPYSHGEAFPGLIHLSLATFMGGGIEGNTWTRQGMDEWFRAHEVAHQWWGIGVDFSTYHDQWLSEGFASFAGLWYLQTARKDNSMYFDMLARWRGEIMSRGTEPGPVWLGYRAARINAGDNDYNLIVYQKGAWVVHMLRILMLDMKTMSEDRFTNMMRDFFATYQGRRASTDDFRRVVEKHTGVDMAWFFDQWVRQAALPTWRVAHRTEAVDGGKFKVTLQVAQENVPETFRMYVPVTVDLGKNQMVRARVQVTGANSRIELPLLPSEPKAIRFNDFEGALAEVQMVAWKN